MIDGIGLSLPEGGSWSPAVHSFLNTGTALPSGWVGSKRTTSTPETGIRVSVSLTHTATGLTLIGDAAGPKRLCFCPARMLRPTNVLLPSTDEEIADAWAGAQAIASEVCELPAQRGHLSRLDLCLYVQIATERLVHLFDRVRAPGFRKATFPERYEGGLRWHGSKKNLLFYNKGLEQGEQQPDGRTRLELQLHGDTIARALGFDCGGKVREVSVRQCYQALRRYLLTFPVATTAPTYNQDALVAHAMAMGVRAPDGRSVLEWRLEEIADQAHRQKKRKKIEGMVLDCAMFRWSDHLPENPTPEQWRRLCGHRD